MSNRNIFDENHITLRDLPELLEFCNRRKRSLMIFGGAGLGKSQVIKQCADSLFGEHEDNLVDFRLSDKEPSDASGVQIPYTDEKGDTRTVYAIPDFWPRDPDWKGIIFLDELLHAEPHLQKLAFQIMLDRKIGTYSFPAGAVMVGAGNRPDDGTAVTMLEAPLANRMILAELEYDTQVFIEDYAMHNGVHPSVIGYLSSSPSSIENYEDMADIGSPSFATPRTWVTTSDILFDYDAGLLSTRLAKTAIQGSIGKALMYELWAYHTISRKLTPIKDIMSGAVKKHTGPDSSDILWMMGAEGTLWIRKAIADESYTDEEVMEFIANYLTYLNDNFSVKNKDFVSSVFLSFLMPNAFGKAILLKCGRDKLAPRLLQQHPVVMKIINDYKTTYMDQVKEVA